MLGIDFGNTTMDRNQASNFAEMVYRASVDAGIIPIFPSGSSVTLSMPLIIEENQLIDSIHLFGKAVQTAESC